MLKRLFLFITANKIEQKSFLSKLYDQKEKTFDHGVVCTFGTFGKYTAAHFHSPYQGSEAIMSISNAIEAIKPDAVLLIGIACGANIKKQNQCYGDVLISKNVIDHDVRKENAGDTELRGVIVPSGDILYSLFNQRSTKWELTENGVSCHLGSIICSSVLLNNAEKKKDIFELYNNYPIGYEMEGIEAFRVCRNKNIAQWIVVKGISDFGDGNKNDDNQIIAANNAVSLCHYVFSYDGLDGIPKVFSENENKVELINTPKFYPAYGNFIGRITELQNIDEVLTKSNHVFLYGIGGIGKSELAKKYAEDNRNKYDIIQLVNYDTNLKRTISMNVKFQNLNEREYQDKYGVEFENMLYKDKIDNLMKYDQKTLIIIDNYNVTDDNYFFELIKGNYRIIFTTRNKHNQNEIEIGNLNKDLTKLFEQYCMKKLISDELDYSVKLINLVDGHTMTIELIAKTMKRSRIQAEMLFKLMSENIDPKLTDRVKVTKDDKTEEDVLYKHLINLFKINKLAETGQNSDMIMMNMSLIPFTGIKTEIFHNWLDLENYNNLEDLIDRGWIKHNDIEDTISLHPLISEIVAIEMQPDSKKCAKLIQNMINFIETCKKKGSRWEGFKLIELAIKKRIHDETELSANFYEAIADLYLEDNETTIVATLIRNYIYRKFIIIDIKSDLIDYKYEPYKHSFELEKERKENNGSYINALDLYKRSMKIRESIYGINSILTARSYNSIGIFYLATGDYKTAIEFFQNSLRIKESILSEKNTIVANAYNYLGITYRKNQDNIQARNYYQKVISILQDLSEEDSVGILNKLSESEESVGEMYLFSLCDLGFMYIHGIGGSVDLNRGTALFESLGNLGFNIVDSLLKALYGKRDLPCFKSYDVNLTNYTDNIFDTLSLNNAEALAEIETAASIEKIKDSVNNFFNITNKNTSENIFFNIAEFCLFQSLVEYLLAEAPPQEQNMFMIAEILGNTSVMSSDSAINYLFDMFELRNSLREESYRNIEQLFYDSKNVLYQHYLEYVILSYEKRKEVINSCRNRLAPIGTQNDIFAYTKDFSDIKDISKLIINNLKSDTVFDNKLLEAEELLISMSLEYLYIRYRNTNEKQGIKDLIYIFDNIGILDKNKRISQLYNDFILIADKFINDVIASCKKRLSFYDEPPQEITKKEDNNSEADIDSQDNTDSQDSADSQNDLGTRYFLGNNIEQDYKQAVYWFRKAAEQGHAIAQYNLGQCYYYGKGIEQDFSQAIYWFKKSANQGNSNAQNILGSCYYKGDGVPLDYSEAACWFKKAANKNHTNAEFNLGQCLYYGNGLTQDIDLAVYWYTLAAKKGHADAQHNLGNAYSTGIGVAQDYKQAVYWFTKAAEQEQADSQNNLGWCYFDGNGVVQDYKQAVHWFQMAAERNNDKAQNTLGTCYYIGKGITQDYVQALYWFTRSAEHGHAGAQFSLGVCFYNGKGTDEDKKQALYWFTKSAEQGYADAKHLLKKLYDIDH